MIGRARFFFAMLFCLDLLDPGFGRHLRHDLFYCSHDLLSFVFDLFFGPQETDGGRDAAAHDLIAGGEAVDLQSV